MPFVPGDFPAFLVLGLATVLGQVGGAFGARKTHYVSIRASLEPIALRFGIRQLLILTVWLALVMTVLKLTGMATESYFAHFGVWLVIQFGGLSVLYYLERASTRDLLAPTVPRETTYEPASPERQRRDRIDRVLN